MSQQPAVQTSRCTQCGASLIGRFCSECGSPAGSSAALTLQAEEGWGGIAREFLQDEERRGFFKVALSLVRHPVDTAVRLTGDPAYRSHRGFMTGCLGAQLTLTYLMLPRLTAMMLGAPASAASTPGSPSVLTSELVQYAGFFLLIPVQYYLCRMLGAIKRSPRSYAKLCAMSVSYGALLSTMLLSSFALFMLIAMKQNVPLDYVALGTAVTAINVVAVLVFVTWTHKIFWGMKWVVAAIVTLAIAALSWGVVYPGLGLALQKSGVSRFLDSLFT